MSLSHLMRQSQKDLLMKKITERKIVNNYGSFDLTFVKGKGSTMWDSEGKKYIDFTQTKYA